jgi:hypothetical protein
MSKTRAYSIEEIVFDPADDDLRESQSRRFNLVRLGDIAASRQRRYIVKDIIPRAGIVVIWGPPKCGKSFWTLDLLLHIALGRQYRGRRTIGGPALYLALEGQAGFDDRVEAFKRANEWAKDGPFYLIKTRLNLVRDCPLLIRDIREQTGEAKPTVIAIDTLNRSLVGSESKDEDMSAYLAAAESIRDAFDSTIIIVHHCGVDGTRPRGHTSLTGTVDAQLSAVRDAQKNVIVKVEYMKDGEDGAIIASRLDRVEIGADEDGGPISTCVVVPMDVDWVCRSLKPVRKLPNAAKIAQRALVEAIERYGEPAPPSTFIPSGLRVVTEDQWREVCYQFGISEGERRAREIAFSRARSRLVADQIAGTFEGRYWVTLQQQLS